MSPDLVFDQAFTVFNKVLNLLICQVNKINEQPPTERTCLCFTQSGIFWVFSGAEIRPFSIGL